MCKYIYIYIHICIHGWREGSLGARPGNDNIINDKYINNNNNNDDNNITNNNNDNSNNSNRVISGQFFSIQILVVQSHRPESWKHSDYVFLL